MPNYKTKVSQTIKQKYAKLPNIFKQENVPLAQAFDYCNRLCIYEKRWGSCCSRWLFKTLVEANASTKNILEQELRYQAWQDRVKLSGFDNIVQIHTVHHGMSSNFITRSKSD